MNNLNFTISSVPDNENSFDNDSKKESIIKLNERLAVPQEVKTYLSIYLYIIPLIISAWVSVGLSNPIIAFLILATISLLLASFYISAHYKSLGFLVTNTSITVYWGIFVKKSKTVLFDTVQTMESKGGLIMSMLGIVNFKINIILPSQININSSSITKTPDCSVVLTPVQADWLVDFISNAKKRS